MKNSIKYFSFAVLAFAAFSAFKPSGNGISVGTAAVSADVKMKDVSGKELSLNDMKGQNGMLVIFISNNCPFVKLNEAEIAERADHVANRGYSVVFVNSNEGERKGNDSYEAMQKFADTYKKKQLSSFYYVMDKDAVLAKSFGATHTPEFFLFDKTKLVYKGALSSNDAAAVNARENYLRNAIVSTLEGMPVGVSSTPAKGSTIKAN